MFGINGSEFVVLIVLGMLLVGPDKIPEFAANLRAWTKKIKGLVKETEQTVKEELGDAELSKLDPRQYDPRRIFKEAFNEDDDETKPRPEPAEAGKAPYDAEAT